MKSKTLRSLLLAMLLFVSPAFSQTFSDACLDEIDLLLSDAHSYFQMNLSGPCVVSRQQQWKLRSLQEKESDRKALERKIVRIRRRIFALFQKVFPKYLNQATRTESSLLYLLKATRLIKFLYLIQESNSEAFKSLEKKVYIRIMRSSEQSVDEYGVFYEISEKNE